MAESVFAWTAKLNGVEYNSIQDACNNLSGNYQTIIINSGTLNEDVNLTTIYHHITIMGQGQNSTIINGKMIFTNMNDLYLQDFKVTNNGRYGYIWFINCVFVEIWHVKLEQVDEGDELIWAYNCEDLFYWEFQIDNCDVGLFLEECTWSNIGPDYPGAYNTIIENANIALDIESNSLISLHDINFDRNTWDLYCYNYCDIYGASSCFFSENSPCSKIYSSTGCYIPPYTYDCPLLKQTISDYITKTSFGKNDIHNSLTEFSKLENEYYGLLKEVNNDFIVSGIFEKEKYYGQFQSIIDKSKAFIEQYPNSSTSRYVLSLVVNVYKKINEEGEATNFLENILTKGSLPNIIGEAKFHLIEQYIDKKEYITALKIADEMVDNQKTNISLLVKTLCLKGFINEFYLGNEKVAVAIYEDIIKKYSDNSHFAERRIGVIEKIKEKNIDQLSTNSVFRLNNYPNPFNPSTRINYYLPISGRVIIKIYDITGREVITLVEGIKEKGEHFINWTGKNNNGFDIPSGIYFCHIRFNNNYLTRKMMLLR